MNMNIRTFFILFLLLVFFDFEPVQSQVEFDNKGRDFWLTFIPNFHNNKEFTQGPRTFTDSLNIYISSEKATKGIITYRDSTGKEYTHNFQITDTNVIHRFSIHYRGFELDGYNNHGNDWGRYQTERPAFQTFHVETEEDVTVYALSQANYTSDAFLVFPTDVLGEDYYIFAYNGDGNPESLSRTPSQFAIVAVEDNTIVKIDPKTFTYVNGNTPFSVTLNKGEAYLVQSAFDRGDDNPDLTGTSLKSNKPIAVFSGHQRSKIPIETFANNPSRDILVEQLQPFKNWGKNAFIIPLVQPYNIAIDGYDLFRVMAAKDSTEIYLNDEYITTIDEGEFLEAPSDKIFIIRSNNPISVAQYKKTSKNGGADLNISDPYMLVIPPKEQYLNSYRIINAESWDYGNDYFRSFTEQYITMIVPDTALNTVMVDNKLIDYTKFRPIPNSGYSYLNYATVAGVHSVNASAPFGIYITGFGTANSYGYLGGMSFTPLNFRAPRILAVDSCHSVKGHFEKYSKTDFGLWDVTVDSAVNVNVSIAPYIKNADYVSFSATLIDYRLDGSFYINSWDSLGNSSSEYYTIPGYTIGLEGNNLPTVLPVISKTIRTKHEDYSSLVLENYGSFSQVTNNIFHRASELRILTDPVQSFLPNSKKTIEYWFRFDFYLNRDTLISDTLFISDGCIDRPIAIIEYLVKGDPYPPQIGAEHSPCDTMITAQISELQEFDYGIKSIDVIYEQNCTVSIESFTENTAVLNVLQIDKSYDAIFRVDIRDSAENVRTYYDTISGNNIIIDQITAGTNKHSFGENVIGHLVCDSLNIRNNGPTEIRIESLRLSENTIFSIPQSQLPFIIPAGQVKALFICHKTSKVQKDNYTDTLVLNIDCVEKQIVLEVTAKELIRQGSSQCNANIIMVTKEVPKDFFIDHIYPNPLSEQGTVNIGVPSGNLVSIKIYDILGRIVLSQTEQIETPGIYEINLNTQSLTEGVYHVTIQFQDIIHSKEFRKITP